MLTTALSRDIMKKKEGHHNQGAVTMAQVLGIRNSDGSITVVAQPMPVTAKPAGAKKNSPTSRNAPVHHSSKPISDGRVADAIVQGMRRSNDDPNGPAWTLVPVASKRGSLTAKTRSQRSLPAGRRNASPWQAKAMGGKGIIAPEDMTFTRSPGDTSDGYQSMGETFPGKDAIGQNRW